MKKSLFTLIAAAMMAAAVSCDSITGALGGTKMDTVDATTKVAEAIKKNINLDEWKIYEIYWMEGEELENDLQIVCLGMINKANDCFTQSLILGGQAAGTVTELRKATGIGMDKQQFDAIKGIDPSTINAETIQKQYEDAKAQIPEEYQFKSISRYNIYEVRPSGNDFLDRGKNIGEIMASFDLNVIEPGKEYVESAGKKSLQYYEIDFNVQPDGTVVMEEE